MVIMMVMVMAAVVPAFVRPLTIIHLVWLTSSTIIQGHRAAPVTLMDVRI